jgi:hypothetical protein
MAFHYGTSRVISMVISDCRFRNTAAEYDRKPGIKRSSGTGKWRSGMALLVDWPQYMYALLKIRA